MLDFPNSPTLNQIFTGPNGTFTWDGAKWAPQSGAMNYLPLTGGTLTGNLTLPNIRVGGPSSSTPPLPADLLNPNAFSSEYVTMGHYAFNAYVSSSGPSWKYLQNGYAGNMYVDGSGNLQLILLPSGTAGAVASGSTFFTFGQNGWLSLSGGFAVNSSGSPTINLNKAASGQTNDIYGLKASVARWLLRLGDDHAETGSGNTGSDFIVYRFNDAGSALDAPFSVSRASGITNITTLTVNNSVQANGGVYSDSTAGGAGQGMATLSGSPSYRVHQYQSGWFWGWNTTTGALVWNNATSGTYNVTLNYDGSCYNKTGTWVANSDARLKQDIEDYAIGLDAILRLRPRRFRYIAEVKLEGTKLEPSGVLFEKAPFLIGLVAQEAQPVMPETIVMREGEIDGKTVKDMHGLDAGPVMWALVNAVRELSDQIAELSLRVSALEATR
jgi:hypothetical protein